MERSLAEAAPQRARAAATPRVIADFQRDGAAPLRGLFSPSEMALLEEGVSHNLASPSARAKVASDPTDPGRFFEDFRNWRRIPAFERFVRETPAAAAAGLLMDSPTARFHHDHVLVKEAGTRQRTPWHQDQPYYDFEGRQTVSLWIPLDPVGREATLEFVARSHVGPWLMPRTFLDRQARWFPEGALAELPRIEEDRAAFPILGWALEPGDAVAFNMLTLHASGGSHRRRRVFSARFIGEDVRRAPRAWPTSPDFPELAEALPAGAAMDHPLFPILWRAEPG